MEMILFNIIFLVAFLSGFGMCILLLNLYKKYEKNANENYLNEVNMKIEELNKELREYFDSVSSIDENKKMTNIAKEIRNEWFFGPEGNE
jgi:hypothetical protein